MQSKWRRKTSKDPKGLAGPPGEKSGKDNYVSIWSLKNENRKVGIWVTDFDENYWPKPITPLLIDYQLKIVPINLNRFFFFNNVLLPRGDCIKIDFINVFS